MATSEEKLSNSLKLLKRLQDKSGLAIVRASELSPIHITRLLNAGFLREVMKGWYISSSPESASGGKIFQQKYRVAARNVYFML